MIQEFKNKEQIINYIGEDYNKCLYLYLDFTQYGIDNPNVKTWVQSKDEDIVVLVLMYYSGMHVFSKNNNYDLEELCQFILEKKPSVICGEKNLIRKIEGHLKKSNYKSEYGWVRELSKIDKKYDFSNINCAKDEDFSNIAKLLYNDNEIGSSYKLDELTKQMIERNKEGFGRNYIIKEDNRIVSHAGTGAENDKVAMLNYVITDDNYRGKGLATRVVGKVCYDLIEEGKKVYLINYSKESTALYNKIGFKVSCDWGKLFLDLKGTN